LEQNLYVEERSTLEVSWNGLTASAEMNFHGNFNRVPGFLKVTNDIHSQKHQSLIHSNSQLLHSAQLSCHLERASIFYKKRITKADVFSRIALCESLSIRSGVS